MAAGLEESGNFGAKFCRRSFQMKSCYLWLLAGCLMLMHRAEGSFAIASKMGLQQNLETFGENRVLDIVPHFLEDTGHPLLHSGAKSRSARNVHGYSSPQHGRKSRPAQVYIFNAFSRQAQLSVSLITASGPKKVLASKIEYGLSRLVHLETLSIYDAFHVEVSRRRHKAAPGKSAIKIIDSVKRNISEVYTSVPRSIDCILIVERTLTRKAAITPIIVDSERNTRPGNAFLYFYSSLATNIGKNLDVLAFSPAQCEINQFCIVRVARNMSHHQGISMEIPVGETFQDYEFKVVEHNEVMTLTDFKNVRSLLSHRVALRMEEKSRNFLILDGLNSEQSVTPHLMAYPEFTPAAKAVFEATQFIAFNSYPSSLKMELNIDPRRDVLDSTSHQELVEYGKAKIFKKVLARHDLFNLRLHQDGSSISSFRINQDIPYANGQCLWVMHSESTGRPGTFMACYPGGGIGSVPEDLSLILTQHSLLNGAGYLNVAFQEVNPDVDKRVFYLITRRLQPGNGMRAFVQPGFYKVKVVPIDISQATQHRVRSMVMDTCVHVERGAVYFGVVHGKTRSAGRFPADFTLLRADDGTTANVNMSYCTPTPRIVIPLRDTPIGHVIPLPAHNTPAKTGSERSSSGRSKASSSLTFSLSLLVIALLTHITT